MAIFVLALVKMTIGICRHARFYLDHKCEINSKRLDPLGPLKGTRFQRGPKGGSSPLDFISLQFQVRHLDFIFGKLGSLNFIFILLEIWYLSFIFRCHPFQFRSNLHLWLERKKKNILDWWHPLQNWHQTVTKVHEIYFAEHCCHVYQTHS